MEVAMVEGKSLHGITEELYRAIVALVDDRVREIRVLRSDFDRLEAAVLALAEAQRRTEERVNELAEAQRRTEERLERLEATVQALAEAQKRTEERLEHLEVTVQALAEAQKRTEEQMYILAQEMTATRRRLARGEDRLSLLYGWRLESLYRERAHAYFGPLLRRVRVIPLPDIEEEVESHLSEAEVKDLLDLDLLVSGRVRQRPELPEVWLAVEVSAVVDRNDVERAARRARLLRRLGRPVVAVVAGEKATAGGKKVAEAWQVLVLRDGQALYWEQALQAALAGMAKME